VDYERIKEFFEPERAARISMSLDLHRDLDCLRSEMKCLSKGSSRTEFSIPVIGEMQKLMETYRQDLNVVMSQLDQQGNQTLNLHNQLMQLRLEMAHCALRAPTSPRSTTRSSEFSPVKLDNLLAPRTPDKGLDGSLTAMMAKSADQLRRKTDENLRRIAGGSPFLEHFPLHDAVGADSDSMRKHAPNIDDLHVVRDGTSARRDSRATQDTKPGSLLRRATDSSSSRGVAGYPFSGASLVSLAEHIGKHSVVGKESVGRDYSRSASEISAFALEDYCQA
jgi:hypothetical protein